MKHGWLTFLRALVLTAVHSDLNGCVPISLDAYATDGSIDSARDAAGSAQGMTGQRGDASARPDAEVPRDGSLAHDATSVGQASTADASTAEATDAALPPSDAGDSAADLTMNSDAGRAQVCADPGVFCDDFEGPALTCPSAKPGLWSACEQLGSAPDPVILVQPAPNNRVFYSSVGLGPGSARVAYDLPDQVAQFHGEFAFFPQPGPNRLYTLFKLEQEAGRDAQGDALHYVGVSLVAREGNLLLVVQTVGDLSKPEKEAALVLRPLPRAWTRVRMDAAFDTEIVVTLRFDEEAARSYPPFASGSAQIDHTAFLLGVYTELEGGAAAFYDDVVISARGR